MFTNGLLITNLGGQGGGIDFEGDDNITQAILDMCFHGKIPKPTIYSCIKGIYEALMYGHLVTTLDFSYICSKHSNMNASISVPYL